MGGASGNHVPPKEYIGDWADGKGTFMIIYPNGQVSYLKKSNATLVSSQGYPAYDRYGFILDGCCTSPLEASFFNNNTAQPAFLVNGNALKKQKPGSVKSLMEAALNNTTPSGEVGKSGGPSQNVKA